MINRALWSAEAEKGLYLALGDDADFIASEVKKGISILWCFNDGWIVTRSEGDELVIVALQNVVLNLAVPLLIEQAKAQGFKSMRCHTSRPSMEKYLKRFGVTRREIVLEIGLDGE